MKLMKKIILALFLSSLLASCTQTSNGVNSGLIYTEWKDRTPSTNAIVDNSVAATKNGQSCVKNILGLVAWGDSSVEEAKRLGGISKVSYIDREFTNFNLIYIPIYAKGCTVVKGN